MLLSGSIPSARWIRSSAAVTKAPAAATRDALARGDAEQVGDAPDEILLEVADPPSGMDDLPHHFNDTPPAVIIDRTGDAAGEVIEIDRPLLGLGCLIDQSR